MNGTENQPNEAWQKDRQNKEMRLWELGGKHNIAEGWWEIIKGVIGFLLIIGLIIYGVWTNQIHQFFPGISLSTVLLAIAVFILGIAYQVGWGVWYIFLGKSELSRKQWTWWYSIITLPIGYIAILVKIIYQEANQVSPLIIVLIIAAITLGFGALYYYTWSIRKKFEPSAVEPIKDELKELSRWPLSKDRPLAVFFIGIFALFALLSPDVLVIGTTFLSVEISLLKLLIAVLTCVLSAIASIGLLRMKKYGFVAFILTSLSLVVLALTNWHTALQNIFLIAAAVFTLAGIYLYFEKEKFK